MAGVDPECRNAAPENVTKETTGGITVWGQ